MQHKLCRKEAYSCIHHRRSCGSVTVFFSLLFPVILALVLCSIASLKVEAGSTETAYAVDESLFTLFSRYDQTLFSKYDLFYLDGSCGTGTMAAHEAGNFTGKCIDTIFSQQNSAIFGSSLLHLKRNQTSVSGYMLMTDAGGASFESQAISSVKDTLGTSALAALDSGAKSQESHTQSLSQFSSALDDAMSKSSADLPAPAPEPVSDEDSESGDSKDTQLTEPAAEVYNPIPLLEALKSRSVLPMVTDDSNVSAKAVPLERLPSHRSLEKGFGTMRISGMACDTTQQFLYKQYLLTHFSNFRKPSTQSDLSYEIEYMIGGSGSDRENLETVVKKILHLRQIVNFAFLMTDPQKAAELDEAALSIASAVFLPSAAGAVKMLLAAGWSYAESLIDVRDLLDGKKVGLTKNAAAWQIEFEEIPAALADPAAFMKGDERGLAYADFLRLLLFKDGQKPTMRAVDMVELEMRSMGRSTFRADCLFDSLDLHIEVTCEEAVPITYEAHYDYRSLSSQNKS